MDRLLAVAFGLCLGSWFLYLSCLLLDHYGISGTLPALLALSNFCMAIASIVCSATYLFGLWNQDGEHYHD